VADELPFHLRAWYGLPAEIALLIDIDRKRAEGEVAGRFARLLSGVGAVTVSFIGRRLAR